ncbi:hypothetical protein [Flavobacterium sp. MDT1-60]|uniref:hypothetical protein n=1 Tax=Flavobacterium sp. MDT1-60 TaxID=1979344 RepID=UPI001782BABC|nr:hypothetical protein [Flavobacterium sp. MDT1-60]QOG01652.1 hypothetical protein IHE43_17855 [Flavobacterium sp. MDT1-60]
MLKKIAFLSLILLVSCQKNETIQKKNEDPKAFEEKTFDIGRPGKGNDLVENLYQELVDKSPELTALENELNEVKARDTTDIFYNYDQKSDDYYNSAESHISGIRDSIMKQKMINLIKKSQDKYFTQKVDLENLVNTINKKRSEITNYHTALKIILTIPLIEQYQKQHLPNKSPFEKLIEKENQLLEKTKRITPKY